MSCSGSMVGARTTSPRPFSAAKGAALCAPRRPSQQQQQQPRRRAVEARVAAEVAAAVQQQAIAYALVLGAEGAFSLNSIPAADPGRPKIPLVAAGVGGTLAVRCGLLRGGGRKGGRSERSFIPSPRMPCRGSTLKSIHIRKTQRIRSGHRARLARRRQPRRLCRPRRRPPDQRGDVCRLRGPRPQARVLRRRLAGAQGVAVGHGADLVLRPLGVLAVAVCRVGLMWLSVWGPRVSPRMRRASAEALSRRHRLSFRGDGL